MFKMEIVVLGYITILVGNHNEPRVTSPSPLVHLLSEANIHHLIFVSCAQERIESHQLIFNFHNHDLCNKLLCTILAN